MLKFAQKLAADGEPKAPCLFAELYKTANEEGRYALDERAAIYEYEAGLTRDEAEAKAALDFSRRITDELQS
jgi:hypothetical protein